MYANDVISFRLLLNSLFTLVGRTTRQLRTSTSVRVQFYIWCWHFVVGDDRWDTIVEVAFIRRSILGVVCSSIVLSNQSYFDNQIHLFTKSVLNRLIQKFIGLNSEVVITSD